MQKYLLIALLLGGLRVHACDVCGCAAGPISLGNVSTFGYHYFGFQANYLQTRSLHEASIFNPAYLSQQKFISGNIQGKLQINKRISLLGSLPVWSKTSIEQNQEQTINGIGDLSTQLQFTFYQKSDSAKQVLFNIASGVKAPTGLWKGRESEVQNLYPGSGSWDYPTSLQGMYNGKKSLFIGDVNYLYRNYNKKNFRFGDSFSSAFSAQYIWNKGNSRVFLGAGLQYTLLLTDRVKNSSSVVTNNHGDFLTLDPKITLLVKRSMIKAQIGIPLYQNLGNGNVHLNPILQIQFIQLIQKKTK